MADKKQEETYFVVVWTGAGTFRQGEIITGKQVGPWRNKWVRNGSIRELEGDEASRELEARRVVDDARKMPSIMTGQDGGSVNAPPIPQTLSNRLDASILNQNVGTDDPAGRTQDPNQPLSLQMEGGEEPHLVAEAVERKSRETQERTDSINPEITRVPGMSGEGVVRTTGGATRQPSGTRQGATSTGEQAPRNSTPPVTSGSTNPSEP